MPVKPSEKEEEYFARVEFERKKKEQEESRKRLEAEEKTERTSLHALPEMWNEID